MTGAVPVGYSRIAFRFANEMDRPLTDDDAKGMCGTEITIEHGGVVTSKGTITNTKVLDDGAALWVIAETGGRMCAACGHIWPADTAAGSMTQISDVLEAAPLLYSNKRLYADMPAWSPVCGDMMSCLFRRIES